MSNTLDSIQSDIAAILDGNPDTSKISNGDYTLRKSYINIALGEYENAYDWQHLHQEYNVLVSTSTNNASIALPQDFKKPSVNPLIDGKEFPIIRLQDNRNYSDTKQRVAFMGNPRIGYTMRVFGTDLASGVSISIPYYMSAGSLATTTDLASIPDTSFLSRRAIALWYESQEDARFLAAKLEAERILSNLIDYENVFPEGSNESRARSSDEDKGFRMGED